MAEKQNVIHDGEQNGEGEPQSKKQKVEDGSVSEGILLGYGNPLLDIQVVGTEEFLKKYDLLANNAILAEDKHKPMYQDMTDTFKEVTYVPGGATLNTIKVAQWLTNTKNASTFFGCTSKDKYGSILEDKAREMGVNMQLQYTEKEPTGTCAVIVTGENRSMCANLAAANCFTDDHLDNPDNWALVEKAQFYYCAAFPLTVSPKTVLRLAKHSHEKGKTFCMNLSAPFLCQFFKEPLLNTLPYVDFLFGNETEAVTFSKENELETEKIPEIALKIAAWKKENKDRARMVIITQGDLSVVVAHEGKVQEFEVIPLKSEDLVDTNGAGDAFVGGFLSQLIQDKPLADCVRCGNYAANLVIQRSGCTVPDKPEFK
ncbi:uncharacterized protein LOC128206616 [Mya arenaria]|uniref:uncharacterized protein LOC128206616 n=1 Tax=Mya arenaria TaxID=6604 RepID=UPI0022E1D64B|nr:uncharacterized protein LOC128206616 [Mya arenaria]